MGDFTGPLGLGVVVGGTAVPTSSTSGSFVFSGDQLVLDVIQGKTIYGGTVFTDTLGGFFPIVINPSGLTLNSSTAHPTGLVFHNTMNSGADVVLAPNTAGSVLLYRNSASAGTVTFGIFDSNDAVNQRGFDFFGDSAHYFAIQINTAYAWINKTHVIWTKAGIPADSDFTASGALDGMLVLDTTDTRLYVRSGGAWHYATLT